MAIVDRGFRVGDLVRWTSASRGVWRHHVGVVVASVPAGERPRVPPGSWVRLYADVAATRPHASFLVALKRDGRGAGLLYWPRLTHLRSYEGEQVVEVPVPRRRRAVGPLASALLEGRALVVWQPRPRSRWRRPALWLARAAAAGAFVVLVVGLHGAFP